MGIIFYEPVVQRVLRSPLGMVGQNLAVRAERVRAKAEQNASGPILGIQTGDLLAALKVEIHESAFDLEAVVSDDSTHRDFHYPTYWDQNGRPWLTDALSEAIL